MHGKNDKNIFQFQIYCTSALVRRSGTFTSTGFGGMKLFNLTASFAEVWDLIKCCNPAFYICK